MRHAFALPPLRSDVAPAAGAQALDGRVGRFYEDAGWTLYRLGLSTRLGGPFGLAYHGSYLTREGDGEGAFAGIGADLTAFRGQSNGPYLVAGLGGGLGLAALSILFEPLGLLVGRRGLPAVSVVRAGIHRRGPMARAVARCP